jgi:glycosyltransferase involved in cell wall biosynthesis
MSSSAPLLGVTVAHLGHHDPSYARNRILRKALQRAGATVVEISHRERFLARTPKLIVDGRKARTDVVLLGFPGHSDVGAARLVSLRRSVPIVFDALVSLWETAVLDRGVIAPKSLSSIRYHLADRVACSLSDVVLLDTDAHIEWFGQEFRVPSHKLHRVWVGADDDIMKPSEPPASHGPFTVFFYGSYIPLHGVEHILGAAQRLLRSAPEVRFMLCGSGQTYPAMRWLAAARELDNVHFLARRSPADLGHLMSQSDVCLGVFGTSQKAQLVIPNKVFDALACKRPVITADTPAARECLTHGRHAWLCHAGDSQALADSIMALKADPVTRTRLADAGHELFRRRFSLDALASDVWPIIQGAVDRRRSARS